jgi:hypothetical protein
MPILKAGLLYFVLVFGAGFVLGTIRTLWIVPGLRNVNGQTDGNADHARDHHTRSAVNGSASCCAVHIACPTWRGFCRAGPPAGRGIHARAVASWPTIREYLASRDPASGTVYYATLGVFAIMPLVLARR